MKLHFHILILLAVTICLCSEMGIAGDSYPTAISIIKEMDLNGEQAFIHNLYQDPELFRYVISNIETASDDWIRVAVRLYRHSQSSLSSELESALSIALSKKPRPVLTSLSDRAEVKAICGAPFLVDYPDLQKGYAILERTKQSLRQVQSTALREKKELCLGAIDVQIEKMRSSKTQ